MRCARPALVRQNKESQAIVNANALFLRILYLMMFRFSVSLVVLVVSMSMGTAATAIPKNAPPVSPAANIGGALQAFTVTLPDLKLPGKTLCRIQAKTANLQFLANGSLGNLLHISALMYQKGIPAATLTAPRAEGSNKNKTVVIVATGGVVVKSLKSPGTKLQADTVTWYANLDKIIATGHVFYRDGKTGTTMTGPSMSADTRLKTIQTGPGHVTGLL